MKRSEFKPGVVFREKLHFQSDKGDPAIYELVEHGVSHSVFTGLRHMEIREVFGSRRFVGVVAEKDRFLAVMFVMGEAVVIKARYENLERIPALEKAMKELKQKLNYAMPVNGKSCFAVVAIFAYKVRFSTSIMGQLTSFEVNLSDIQLLTINPTTSC